MADIKVELVNYSMMYIDCERGIAQELSEYFSFYVPGYKFMPSYRNKVWDGKIRLFNYTTAELNAGLYQYLCKFAYERNYTVETLSNPQYGSPSDTYNTSDLSQWIHNQVQTSLPFAPRNYQEEAIKVGLKAKRAILLSPTGSGKSFIIYLLMKYYLEQIENDKKVLIIVPTTSLVEQMYSDFSDYKMDVAHYCHKIYSGKDKNTNKRVVISTWQSIYKHPKAWFKQFGMVIGDECHGFKSKSLSSIMNKATEAEFRFGTTGTLDGTQTHRLVLEGLFGSVYKVTTTKKLQDNNTLAPLDIKVLLLNYSEEVRRDFGKRTYQQEIDFIIGHDSRNRLIRNLALDSKGNTLVLYLRVEAHGKPLYSMINSKAEDGRKVFFVSGEVDTADRESIRQIVETQNNAIIVASLGTFSTGINIRNLHNIIFASPSKSQIKVLQSIGRGLRKSDNGQETKLFDIADDLHWKSQKNYTLLHSAERIKIYDKEQFNYKIVKVDIV